METIPLMDELTAQILMDLAGIKIPELRAGVVLVRCKGVTAYEASKQLGYKRQRLSDPLARFAKTKMLADLYAASAHATATQEQTPNAEVAAKIIELAAQINK